MNLPSQHIMRYKINLRKSSTVYRNNSANVSHGFAHKGKGKGKLRPTTGHEGSEGGVGV